MKMIVSTVLLCLSLLSAVYADTPANCTYDDIVGDWVFQEGSRGHDRTLTCAQFDPVSQVKITLQYPDVATDEDGNEGFWTLIYNQGFEVAVHGRKYFAFSKYEGHGKQAISVCDQTMNGWAHDVMDRDWACFSGSKTTAHKSRISVQPVSFDEKGTRLLYKRPYKINAKFLYDINTSQKSWMATVYPQFQKMTAEDLIRMAGGRKSRIPNIPKPAPVTEKLRKLVKDLPDAYDWRNVDGVNYVSPVRNQGACGSCYAFGSMAMHEARIRLMSNNTMTPVFSTQDIVECSEYSQGCEGGFPYLIGGKYAEDFGLVTEDCNPYKGMDSKVCHTNPSCARQYATRYEYIGGYYGACNEELMRMNLVKYGPMAVSFEVYQDFLNYKGGIYHHTGLEDKYNPFEITNHAVLLVGYGVDTASGQKYWIVKNSWGKTWGEDGFFRIRRGTDECSIESIAVQSFPIL